MKLLLLPSWCVTVCSVAIEQTASPLFCYLTLDNNNNNNYYYYCNNKYDGRRGSSSSKSGKNRAG